MSKPILDYIFSILYFYGAIIIPFFVGFVFVGIFKINISKKESLMYLYPFIGISIIVLIFQNLVYLNIPLKYSSIPFFFLFIVFLIIKFVKKQLYFKSELLYVFISISVIFVIHGIGYMRETAKWYIGYGWQDQYNYTVTAEFLKEYPFSTEIKDIKTPYLVKGVSIKNDRIGQSIYHGFLSSIFNVSSEYTYGAVSLIAPVLTFFSFLYLFVRIKAKKFFAYLFSIGISCLPAVSLVHLENFLSQALGTPFFITTIAYILFLNLKEIKWRDVFILSLFIATANAIYTEYTLFILFVIFIKIVFNLNLIKNKILNIGILLASLFFAIIENFFFFGNTLIILKRVALPGILSHVYYFNNTIYGYNRFYFGDLGIAKDFKYFIVFLVLIFSGILGMIYLLVKRKDINILILFGFPVSSIFMNIFLITYPYQTYKLMLSFLPILFVGIYGFIELIYCSIKKYKYSFYIGIIVILFIFITPIYSTMKLSNYAYLGKGRSMKNVVSTVHQQLLYQELESTINKNIFINSSHPYELARMVYFGRNNNLWFQNPIIGDFNTLSLSNFKYTDLNTMPGNIEQIKGIMTFPYVDEKKKIYAHLEGSTEGVGKDMWIWLGKSLPLKIYTKNDQIIRLSFDAYSGIANKDKYRVISLINKSTGQKTEINFTDKILNFSEVFYIQKGLNEFYFETIYPLSVEYIPKNDKRIFMVMIKNAIIK